MEQALVVFEPLKAPGWPVFFTLLGALAIAAAMALQLRNKALDRNRRIVLSMLLFFSFLIALFTGGGIALNASKFQKVTIYGSGVSIGKKQIAFSDMRGYMIREDRRQSTINPSMTTRTVRTLVIEEKTGKTHLLPEEYYDLSKLMNALDGAYEEWRR